MGVGLTGIGASALPAGVEQTGKKAAEAAGQFESMLIAQMLKSMRESESGWLGTGSDTSADSAMAMAEEHFASAISAAGGFGLAKIVNSGLKAPNIQGSVPGVAELGGKGGGSGR